MTPARIAELRRAGVLDGTRADDARIALLDIYEARRADRRLAAPDDDAVAHTIASYLRSRSGTWSGALRWARAAMRRRAKRQAARDEAHLPIVGRRFEHDALGALKIVERDGDGSGLVRCYLDTGARALLTVDGWTKAVRAGLVRRLP